MTRCLTIDVEEYFHIEAAHARVGRDTWDQRPSRVERNVNLLLEMLATAHVSGTFFFLGDVARRCPHLAGRVAAAGHEIASHGTGHDRLHRLDAASLRRDVGDGRKLLQDQTGQAVVGYRAPTFSLVPATAWAIDVLAEAGFLYDSSIFPVRHPAYGVPTAPDRPFLVRGSAAGATLLEAPPLTLRLGRGARGPKLAVAGGGYFRLLPLVFMETGLRQAAKEQRPAVLYFHPWEFDPHMPRLPLSAVGRWRTYTGLRSAARKLKRILNAPARWVTMAQAMPEFRTAASGMPTFDLHATSSRGNQTLVRPTP